MRSASCAAVGVTTVVPQILLPLAAGLAPPAERGRVVGRIVSGILVGILGARGVAGVVGRAAGWRAMFVVAAGLMLLLALALARWLPTSPPLGDERPTYGALLRSLVALAREQPVLRDAVVLALPVNPLCRQDCPGLCPECGVRWDELPEGHTHEQVDPRWAALGKLKNTTEE